MQETVCTIFLYAENLKPKQRTRVDTVAFAWYAQYIPSAPLCTIFLFGGEVLANTENLVSLADRTTEEQRAIASAGGKASGEARRKRKTLKEELLLMLSEGETQQSVTLALIEKAMSGDTKAFEVIRDTIGEKPVDKVMIADVEPSVIAEVEAMVLTDDDEATGG
jgi:hypothetical protein